MSKRIKNRAKKRLNVINDINDINELGACGECTACCTALWADEVPTATGENASKPAGVDCHHLLDDGCAIYEDRPSSCRGFICHWLYIKTQPADPRLDPSLDYAPSRPDKLGIIVDVKTSNLHPLTVCAYEVWPGAFTSDLAVRVMAGTLAAYGGQEGVLLKFSFLEGPQNVDIRPCSIVSLSSEITARAQKEGVLFLDDAGRPRIPSRTI